MDKSERKRLKQLGKELAEHRSRAVHAQVASENPWPVGSAEWIARYKELHAQGSTNTIQNKVVDEGFFKLVLPGLWGSLFDGERWTYDGSNEQLTVSVMPSDHRMADDEQAGVLRRVAELRQKAEEDTVGSAGLRMTDATFARSGAVHAARYAGVEAATQRHFHCLSLCSPSAVTVFYYESLGMSQEEAESRAKVIFNSVVVAQ
jgi:hypothetical protein